MIARVKRWIYWLALYEHVPMPILERWQEWRGTIEPRPRFTLAYRLRLRR